MACGYWMRLSKIFLASSQLSKGEMLDGVVSRIAHGVDTAPNGSIERHLLPTEGDDATSCHSAFSLASRTEASEWLGSVPSAGSSMRLPYSATMPLPSRAIDCPSISTADNHSERIFQMSEREVPIQKNEMSILDNEFSSIREKFEAEMNKMEQEMARFRSMVLDHEKNIFNKAIEPGTVSFP